SKMYEFNLSLDRLVKWPVYVLHSDGKHQGYKLFELLREWETKEAMDKELNSSDYENLMGTIKVLGEIKESHLYETVEHNELLL
ncbi:MAG: hypothetical protein HKN89_08715, partial [Eudoraea sp.]|nr:hypothetical protein [Eudoraea sp.]